MAKHTITALRTITEHITQHHIDTRNMSIKLDDQAAEIHLYGKNAVTTLKQWADSIPDTIVSVHADAHGFGPGGRGTSKRLYVTATGLLNGLEVAASCYMDGEDAEAVRIAAGRALLDAVMATAAA